MVKLTCIYITIKTAFPTGHAYGIETKEGIEVLVHIGLDAVELNGDGFTVKVETGQSVNVGDVLCVVDIEKVKQAGKSLVSPVIITSGQSITNVQTGSVQALDEVATIQK